METRRAYNVFFCGCKTQIYKINGKISKQAKVWWWVKTSNVCTQTEYKHSNKQTNKQIWPFPKGKSLVVCNEILCIWRTSICLPFIALLNVSLFRLEFLHVTTMYDLQATINLLLATVWISKNGTIFKNMALAIKKRNRKRLVSCREWQICEVGTTYFLWVILVCKSINLR